MLDTPNTPHGEKCVANAPEAFASAVERAARSLFGGSELYLQLVEVTRRLQLDCQRLRDRGQSGIPSIVLVGGVGEGKSWLARCFINAETAETVRNEIGASGELLTWFGPEKPFGLDDNAEQFLRVRKEQMLDLGCPYVVGDAPGFTDRSAARERLSGLATSSAPIKVLVTSVTELRDGRTDEFIGHMDGSLILPVVRFEAADSEAAVPDEAARTGVIARIARWKQAAPAAEFLPPCFMPTQRIFGAARARELMRDRLTEALAPQLLKTEHLAQSVERQVAERIKQARREMADLLKTFRQRVTDYMVELDQTLTGLPQCLQEELLGEDMVLRIAICQRFRADWISRTPLVCFPYRSLLGLLSLTAGAWDRLMLSFVGSLPSLAMTVFQSVKNVRDAMGAIRRLRQGAASRVQGRIEDELLPQIQSLQTALASSLPEDQAEAVRQIETVPGFVRVQGLDRMETESRRIINASVQRRRASLAVVSLFAVLGTGVFFYLLSGPVLAIYETYLHIHWEAICGHGASWNDFPTPSVSMLFSSLLLSLLPTFLIALCGIWWSCHTKRVQRTVDAIKAKHEAEIQRRAASGSLQVVLVDPVIDAARLLLSLAKSDVAVDPDRQMPN